VSEFELVFEGGWRERVAASGDVEPPDEFGEARFPTFDPHRLDAFPWRHRGNVEPGLSAMRKRLAGLTHNRSGRHVTRDTRTRATLEHELEHAHELALASHARLKYR